MFNKSNIKIKHAYMALYHVKFYATKYRDLIKSDRKLSGRRILNSKYPEPKYISKYM